MGYCDVSTVAGAFPQFARNAAGSVSDAQIANWIEYRAARIRSAFLSRGIDADNVARTPDPDNPAPDVGAIINFLAGVNADGAIADLADALQGTVNLQPGEYALAQARRATYERVLKEILAGVHDKLFIAAAKTVDVRPQFGGVAGAETDAHETPESRAENRAFGRNQTF